MASYGSVAGVQAIVPAYRITAESNPSQAQVEAWLDEGRAEIERYIAGAGYVVPVEASAAAYASLTAANNLYGAAYVLRSRGIDPASGEQQSSSEAYLKDFYRRLDNLVAMDLTLLGLSVLPTPSPNTTTRRINSLHMVRIDGYNPDGLTD